MVPNHGAEEPHNLWSEIKGQQAESEETHATGEEDGQKEVAEVHLRNGGAEHEYLKGHGRGKHPGEHQSPEFVFFECAMNFLEALCGYALPQDGLAADVSDDIERNAAERRSRRGQQHID
jgi:hypothetical protein